jgi:hypothetical protein
VEKAVTARARRRAPAGRIRGEAKEAMSAARNTAGTKPSGRAARPKRMGAGRMKRRPRQATGPISKPLGLRAVPRMIAPRPMRTIDSTRGA